MEPNKDHIKDIFSSKLSDFKPEIPSVVWDKIDKQLNSTTNPVVHKKINFKRQVISIGSWVAGIAAVVLLLLYNIYPLPTDSSSHKLVSSNYLRIDKIQSKHSVEADNKALSDYDKDNKSRSNHKSFLSQSVIDKSIDDNNIQQNIKTNSLFESLDSIASNLFTENTTNDLLNLKEDSIVKVAQLAFDKDAKLNKEIAAKMFELEKDHLDNLLADNNPIPLMPTEPYKGVQVGFQGGSGFFKSDDTKNQLTMSQGGNSDKPITRESKLKMKHNQPITVGLSVSKKISNKLSLESGIVYIYLSSRFKTEDIANIRQHDMQYLHYLGVPLTLNYNFAEWNKFRLYASIGGLFQKDFYGRRSGNTYIDGVLQPNFYYKKKISQNNPQFSVNAGLGASYPLYNKLRVYSNFGGAYYIGAKNDYETIYSDKKWLFNLNIGIRFEF